MPILYHFSRINGASVRKTSITGGLQINTEGKHILVISEDGINHKSNKFILLDTGLYLHKCNINIEDPANFNLPLRRSPDIISRRRRAPFREARFQALSAPSPRRCRGVRRLCRCATDQIWSIQYKPSSAFSYRTAKFPRHDSRNGDRRPPAHRS